MKRSFSDKVNANANTQTNGMELLKKYGAGWRQESLLKIYNVFGDELREGAVAEAFQKYREDTEENIEKVISCILDYVDFVEPPPEKSMSMTMDHSEPTYSSHSPTGHNRIERVSLDTSINSALRKWPEDTRITLRLIDPKVLEHNGGLILNKHSPERGIEPVLNDFITLMRWPADVLDRMHAKYSGLSKLEIFDILKVLDNASIEDLEAILETKSQVPEYECPICMDDCKITDMYTIGCPEMHKICFSCFGDAIKHAISQGDVVRCPYQGCNYVVSQEEIEWFGENDGGYISREEVNHYCEQNLKRAVKSISGAIGCPNPNCNNYVIISREDLSRKVHCCCNECGFDFCSHCRGIYHYHCDCGELPLYTDQWIEWCTKRRNKYTTDKKKAVEMYKRNQELVQNNENLKKDEDYKEANGRLCPNCGRIIVKVDGCDLMVCGRNYHGGDVQDGCGASFNWSQAAPYRSKAKITKVAPIPMPELAKEVVHEGVVCNKCGDEIKGLRFTCIHCPCYDLCEKCEAEGSLEHPKEHIWRIISDPFEQN